MPVRTGYFTHDLVVRPNPMDDAPESPERIDAIESRMMVLGLDDLVERVDCAPVSDDYLLLAHEQPYIESLRRISQSRETEEDRARFTSVDTPVGPGVFEAAARSVGAVVAAVDALKDGRVHNAFCAVRPPGHHAGPARAGGFCYFNNVAIGALYAQLRGFPRVAVLDFDAHHGDGTEEILAHRKDVRFWSLFQWPLYPDRRMDPVPENVTQSPLSTGADGQDLRALLENDWIPALRTFQPDIMFLSSGFDAHNEEHMAQLKFTEIDFAYLTRRLTEEAEDLCGGRLISVLEGGYSIRSLARSVLAHLQTLVRTALERNPA